MAVGAVGAIAEVNDGHHLWWATSGVAEHGTTRPVPARGRFRAGSISKTFVATVVLQLVDEGRLRLDDPVALWLPGVVPDGDRVTVRKLLTQASGLPHVVPTLPKPPDPVFYANRWRTWSADELIARALALPSTSEPGGAFHCSSTNYLLLGQVIEAETTRSYAAEIRDRIIRPLRLRHTTLPDRQLLDYTAMNPSVFGAAGELISSAPDLDRFFAALLRGRLLPPGLLDEHRVTIALTPDFRGDTDHVVDAFID